MLHATGAAPSPPASPRRFAARTRLVFMAGASGRKIRAISRFFPLDGLPWPGVKRSRVSRTARANGVKLWKLALTMERVYDVP
jgi:hypothetical protein